jgi:hypothetical protein
MKDVHNIITDNQGEKYLKNFSDNFFRTQKFETSKCDLDWHSNRERQKLEYKT